MTYEPLSDDALKAMRNATFDGSGNQSRLGIRALVDEVRRSRDLLRWRDSRVEPLPMQYETVEIADPLATWDRMTISATDWEPRSGKWTWWRPLTPGPDDQGERPEAD